MSGSTAAAPARWWALALLGRLGHLLGFRWVYPFGTLPIPFHPLFLPGTLLALLGWLGWRVTGLVTGAATESAWGPALVLLAGAAALGLCLSVPVLSWVVLVLGGRLVQATLVLAAMTLLAVAAGTGRGGAWSTALSAVLPAAFVLVWAGQAIRGRVVRSRLRAAAQEFAPVEARGRAVILGRSVDTGVADAVLDRAGTTGVWVQARRDGERSTARFRVTPELADHVRALARGELPDGARLREHGDAVLLECLAPMPDDAIWVDTEPHDLAAGSVRGDLRRVTFEDTYWSRSVVVGTASVVLPVPMVQCFRWTSLTSPHEWFVGFAHGRAERIGPGRDALHLLLAAGRPADPLGLSATDDVLLPLTQAIADRDAAIAGLRAAALAGPVDLAAHRQTLDLLRRGGRALLGDDAPEFLTAWLQKAAQGSQQDLPSIVAVLVDKLSDEEIATHGDRVLAAFNSRKLALEWELVPGLDPAPLPRDLYRFGDRAGFGLVFRHPALYVRLGELLPPFRDLLAALGREMALPEQVREAQARWSGERSR